MSVVQTFKEIVEGKVFRLELPKSLGSSIILITLGNRNFLVNCGGGDSAVVNYLVPALKKKKIPLGKIDFLMFTNCHPENIGGAYRLKLLAPGIRVMATTTQADRLKNPMFYMSERWSGLEDFAPPFKEIRGIIADNVSFEEMPEFDDISAVLTPGHDEGSVCWWIKDGDIVVCGDALQGAGSDDSGIACYNDLEAYLGTIDILSSYNVSKAESSPVNRRPGIFICNEDINGLVAEVSEDDEEQKSELSPAGVIVGKEKCLAALKKCRKATEAYEAFLKDYMRAHGINKEMMDLSVLASEFFASDKKTEYLGYAMMTFRAHGASVEIDE